MKNKEIKIGETYLFVATDDPKRQDMAGKPFFVSLTVYRRSYNSRHKPEKKTITGFKNADGEFARAEELEKLPDEDVRCGQCQIGEVKPEGGTQPNGSQKFICDNCGFTQTFP